MTTFTWSLTKTYNINTKVIKVYDTTINNNKNISARVFVIDKKSDIFKISVFITCKEDEITDTNIKWILQDIYDQIGYDPNTSKRMLRWFVHYVDKLPDYVDNIFFQAL